MNDIPYIIVDNQRIPPVRRPSRSSRSTGEQTRRRADPFGVVDRVTLSAEGRKRSREQLADADISPGTETPAITGRRSPALLTYSPGRRR